MIQPRQITPDPFPEKRIHRSVRKLDTRGEQGFVLLAVLFMLVLVVLALAIAAPKVATDLQRDKEIETVNRGMQYKRAIKLYYKKFGGYPSSIDQLMNTDGQRFLRKHYLDPITGKDDWRIIHVGEAKVPPMGPFGQPLAGGIPGGTPAGAASPMGSSGSGFGSSSSGFGSSSSGLGSSGSGFGSSGSDSGSSIFGSSNTGSLGSGNSSLPLGGGTSGGTGSATGGPGTGSSAFGTPGATMGGAPIMGVGLPSAKASIKIYKKQTQYNRWEFCYFPNEDLVGGGAMGQSTTQPTGSTGAAGTSPGGGSSTPGFGGSSGSTGFGGSSGTSGSTGFGSSSPTTPSSSTSPFGGSSFP